jgi:hypothetical protein
MRRWLTYLVVAALAGVAIIAKMHPGVSGRHAVTAPASALSSLQPGP